MVTEKTLLFLSLLGPSRGSLLEKSAGKSADGVLLYIFYLPRAEL